MAQWLERKGSKATRQWCEHQNTQYVFFPFCMTQWVGQNTIKMVRIKMLGLPSGKLFGTVKKIEGIIYLGFLQFNRGSLPAAPQLN